MPHELKINRELEIIELKAFGILVKEDMQKTIDDMRKLSDIEGIKEILADVTDVEFGPSLLDTFELFSKFPRDLKQAVFSNAPLPENLMKDVMFIEDVSVNRGLQTRVFSSREVALQWLLGE